MIRCSVLLDAAGRAVVRITQRRNEIKHPLVLGQHVAGSTRIDRISDAIQHGDGGRGDPGVGQQLLEFDGRLVVAGPRQTVADDRGLESDDRAVLGKGCGDRS